MAMYDPVTIQKLDGREWVDSMHLHAMVVNPVKSDEGAFLPGEEDMDTIKFRLRWCKGLEAVQFDKPNHRLVWRGMAFDIRGYDDFMMQHRKVELRCVRNG